MERSISALTYKGTISQAIIESMSSRKLFVLFQVVESASKSCVLLHMKDPQKFVPCVTAIGHNGIQLWQSEGFVGSDVLASSLEKAWLGLHIQETTASVLTASLASKKPEQSASGPSDIGSLEQGSSSGTIVPSSPVEKRAKSSEARPSVSSDIVEKDNGHEHTVEDKFTNSRDETSAESFKILPYDLRKLLSELGLFDRQALIVVPCQKATNYSRGHSSTSDQSITTNSDSSSANDGVYFGFVKRVLSYVNPLSYLSGTTSSQGSGQAQTGMWEYGPNPALQNNRGSLERPYSSHLPNQSTSAGGRNDGNSRKPSTSRYGSNIHTLRHDDDDDRFNDSNAFWNRNSTQYGGNTDGK